MKISDRKALGKRMPGHLAVAMLSLGLAAVAPSAFASTVTVTTTLQSHAATRVFDLPPSGSQGNGFAGEYLLTSTSNNLPGLTLGDYAWCLEPQEYLQQPNTYVLTDLANAPVAGPGTPMGTAAALSLQKLFGGVYAQQLTSNGVGDVAISGVETNFFTQDEIDAFQLAIWEIANERDTSIAYNLTTGDFLLGQDFFSVSNAVINLANGWLAALDSYTPAANLFALLDETNGQDFIVNAVFPDPGPAPVPIPAAGILFGSALAGLVAFGRRRRGRVA